MKKSKRKEHIIIFTRWPEAGRTKTRLIPVLGPEGAADFQRRMTCHTLLVARRAARERNLQIEVRYQGGSAERMKQWLGHDLLYTPQGEGDLGEKMERAMREALAESRVEKCLLVGTDCPLLSPALLARAFGILSKKELVLGPAEDGGYYLVGLNVSARDKMSPLFDSRSIPWGTERVYSQTIKRAIETGLDFLNLPLLPDVDRPDDLFVWEHFERRQRRLEPSLSVIIPALNEETNILRAIRSAKAGRGVEIIVVDGGSTDRTVELARSERVEVLIGPPGRAVQMNVGAQEASGEVLLFLHADSRLPEGYDEQVRLALEDYSIGCGAFRFQTDGAGVLMKFMESLVRFRSRRFCLPYGDQAFFVYTSLFEEWGGYADLPVMEDYEFIRRARRKTGLALLPLSVVTAARRWETKGVIRTTIINQLMILGYHLGLSPRRLAGFYRG